MIKEKAMAYIDSILSAYESPIMTDKHNPLYRAVWLSDQDIIALKLGREALNLVRDVEEGRR